MAADENVRSLFVDPRSSSLLSISTFLSDPQQRLKVRPCVQPVVWCSGRAGGLPDDSGRGPSPLPYPTSRLAMYG